MECSADGGGNVLCILDWILSKNRSEAIVYLLSGLCEDVVGENVLL